MATRKTQQESAGDNAKKGQSFEQAMERLEAIVKQMEAGSLSLEDMIARFEEGQALIKFGTKKLNEVERRIEVLVKRSDGEVVTEPLDAGGEPKEAAGTEDLF